MKIALLQISSYEFDQEKNKLKGEHFCRIAKERNVDLILFPEMWNIGYTPYDESVWEYQFDPQNLNPDLKSKINAWYKHAIDIDSEFIQHFQNLAQELHLAIAITFLQKGNQKPYNSIAIIDRYGKIILNYSKVHTCDFSLEALCETGKDFFVAQLEMAEEKVNIGAMICFDREFPESARILMLKGAEIILVPNSCNIDEHRTAQLKTRAYENMVGIAMTNYPAPKCNGRSQAYSPVAYNANEQTVNNLLVYGDENENIYIAEFNLQDIRAYREREVWGNSYRKPSAYEILLSKDIEYPFKRKNVR